MGDVAQVGAPRHELKTDTAFKTIDKLSNHPYFDPTKTYGEMMEELLQAELYNQDRAIAFQPTFEGRVDNAKNAVVAFNEAANSFEHFKHAKDDFRKLRLATGLIW